MQKFKSKVHKSSQKFTFYPLKGAPMLDKFKSVNFCIDIIINIYILYLYTIYIY